MSWTVPSLRQLTRPASVVLMVAAGAWAGVAVVAGRMGSMPGTMGLGVGAFVAVWALMMAAMMLPSVMPFASLYSRAMRDGRGRRLAAFDHPGTELHGDTLRSTDPALRWEVRGRRHAAFTTDFDYSSGP